MAENSNNLLDALNGLVKSNFVDVNTCLPATIVSYSGGIASVKPTATKRFNDGDALDFPIIPNARVCWPSFAGGSAGVKGPVNAGDRCLLVFAQQAVDGSDDRRIFDLQDAYAIMCDLGNIGGQAGDNSSVTLYYGSAFLKFNAEGALTISAPGGISIEAGDSGTSITGNLNHMAGTITSLGKKIDGTHTHSGVEPGGGNSGAPNA